jgi:Flp pilus assembly protein TadB
MDARVENRPVRRGRTRREHIERARELAVRRIRAGRPPLEAVSRVLAEAEADCPGFDSTELAAAFEAAVDAAHGNPVRFEQELVRRLP